MADFGHRAILESEMKLKDQVRPYTAKNGATQYKPSIQLAGALENEGFCLACGETQSGVEPDARRYVCEGCGARRVYGAQALAMMDLPWDVS
jgi:hypothetical protein